MVFVFYGSRKDSGISYSSTYKSGERFISSYICSSLQALSLAKECYSMDLELLTKDTVVVDDAMRFISKKTII